jgi:UDPglucose--hexose-1-phosphate uridylyltransferase
LVKEGLQGLKLLPHRRFNPLTREWVLVSPQRAQRPWQGKLESPAPKVPEFDPACYLCPSNERASGARNPRYSSTFVFDNDYAALKPDTPKAVVRECNDLIQAQSEEGLCKVVCFSPRHDLTLARMPADQIRAVLDVWKSEFESIGSLPHVNYVQIFENRGEIMGCSNPHPHCQIWANQTIPNEPAKEQLSQQEYCNNTGRCLLCDYLTYEENAGERIVCQNEAFLAVVPFWAIWPFETLLLSRQHSSDIAALDNRQLTGLADILKQLTTRYDRLFDVSFPYSMGFHQRPTDGHEHREWHFHAHYYPPLLRSAVVRKFMVGYEMLASPQRDLTPESAAEQLRQAAKG